MVMNESSAVSAPVHGSPGTMSSSERSSSSSTVSTNGPVRPPVTSTVAMVPFSNAMLPVMCTNSEIRRSACSMLARMISPPSKSR